ncbi:unnamed protein product [Colias eurytheme]|nr:unnamed protein product [Colias eurytheme]
MISNLLGTSKRIFISLAGTFTTVNEQPFPNLNEIQIHSRANDSMARIGYYDDRTRTGVGGPTSFRNGMPVPPASPAYIYYTLQLL